MVEPLMSDETEISIAVSSRNVLQRGKKNSLSDKEVLHPGSTLQQLQFLKQKKGFYLWPKTYFVLRVTLILIELYQIFYDYSKAAYT